MAPVAQIYNRRDLEKPFGFSQAVLAGDYLFVSGCVSWDLEGNPLHAGDFGAQLTDVYQDIKETLAHYGLGVGDIVKETIYTRDIEGLVAANSKRTEFYKSVSPPASTWIEIARLVHPDLLVEVEITAFKNRR